MLNSFPFVCLQRSTNSVTRLIIPGWSILPRYYVQLFPNQTLMIMAPFFKNHQSIQVYCRESLCGHATVEFLSQDELQLMNFQGVDIFSMGLQWVCCHAPFLLKKSACIHSPSAIFLTDEIKKMKSHLKESLAGTLRLFYRQCFHSTMWSWWQKYEMQDHIQYNQTNTLCEWLDRYSSYSVNWEDLKDTQITLDPNDPVGIKPSPSQLLGAQVQYHSHGHMMSPNYFQVIH